MKKILFLLVTLSSLSLAKNLTLDEALHLNEANNYSLKFADKEKQKAEINHLITIKGSLPKVEYLGDFKTEKSEKNMDETQNKHQLKVVQPLFPTTGISGGINFSNISKKLKELEFLAIKRDESLHITQMFITVLKKQNEIKSLIFSLKELDAIYEKYKKMLEYRLITKVELLKIEHSILEIKSSILSCENSIKSIKNNLKLKLGIPKNEELFLTSVEIPQQITHKINFKEDLVQATTKSIDALIANFSKEQAKGTGNCSKLSIKS